MLNPIQLFNKRLCMLSGIILLIGIYGCTAIRSEYELAGTYELLGESQKIILEVLPNGSFAEIVIFASGQVKKNEGSWRWEAGFIMFDNLWIPQSFAPDYINEADATGAVKYTSPGAWSITPEKHWGKIHLPVFDGIDFIMKPNRY